VSPTWIFGVESDFETWSDFWRIDAWETSNGCGNDVLEGLHHHHGHDFSQWTSPLSHELHTYAFHPNDERHPLHPSDLQTQ
jgi:hypothetical protein